jgi:uncharacterized protein (DUF433 family)
MISLPNTVALPLSPDSEGVIRVSGTRVTLRTLLTAYKRGDTPEEIHEGFPTVSLADIYAVIAYYLANQADLDAYLREIDAASERIRQEWEARYTPEQKTRTEHFRKLLAEKRNTTET